ncbi:MAG: hypothetical protein FD145_923 [Candidatus Saganbacteria bacterium]|uniref:Uncharacterized protein n=1 Tax=Candidatus Saganbacteria bacterium TaxID=2575572 RepID=A0A833NRX8_UNCSA|nr:MAG: hypothetical protein FD145_923 [Candidatus Saganbacteria bacterium]
MKRKLMFGGGVGLVVLVFLCNMALAQLTIKNPVVKDKGGAAVNSGVVQMVIGSDVSTPNSAPFFKGTAHATPFPNTDANGVSNLTLQDLPLNATVFIKAWNKTAGAGQYYGVYGPGATGTATQTLRWDSPAITTNYKADKPYTPVITQYEETSTTVANGTKTGTFKVISSQPAATDGLREVHSCAWKMWVKGDAETAPIAGQTGATLSLAQDQVKPNTTYSFKVMHKNSFGDSDWGQGEYKVGGGVGALSVGGEVSYTLNKVENGLGINSIGIAFDAPLTFVDKDKNETPNISTLQDLIDAIGKTGVTATAYWDNGAQQLTGGTFAADGTQTYATAGFEPKNVKLEAGKGYYISVSKGITFKLKK